MARSGPAPDRWKALGVATVWFLALEFCGLLPTLGAVAIAQHMTKSNSAPGPEQSVFIIGASIATLVALGVAIYRYRVEMKRSVSADLEHHALDQQNEQRSSRARKQFSYFLAVIAVIGFLAFKLPTLIKPAPKNIKEFISEAETNSNVGRQYIVKGKVRALIDAPYDISEPGKPVLPQKLLVLRDASDQISIHYYQAEVPPSLAIGDEVKVTLVRKVLHLPQSGNVTTSIYHAVRIEIEK